MAGSRFAYVRDFELSDVVVPHTYMLVRIDGTGFHRSAGCTDARFSQRHAFSKPNDAQALELMNEAARQVMHAFKGHITLAFGESDEYRYVARSDAVS